jgi:[ribosomal protein S5]-alanine N-acetyltransferase
MPPTTLPFPTLATERLRLRAPHGDDAQAFRALLAIPEVTRYANLPDTPSLRVAERMMRRMSRLHETRKGCAWIIEEGASGVLRGAIRFNSFDRHNRVGMVGYELHPAFWGRGPMTEALRAVVGHGHKEFRLNRIEAWTMPGNTASDRVLERTGFQYEGTLRQKAHFKGGYHDFRIFGRVAADPMTWAASSV